jgi:hypothetical protein
VTAVAFGALSDGRTLLATGSEDGTVQLSEIGSNLEVHRLHVSTLSYSTPMALPFWPAALYVGCSGGVVALKLPVFDVGSGKRWE